MSRPLLAAFALASALLPPLPPMCGGRVFLSSSTAEAEPVPGLIHVGVVEWGVTEKPAKKSPSGDWRYVYSPEQALTTARVAFQPVTSPATIGDYRVLVFPYNRFISEDQIQTIQRFIDTGGKTVWFYVCPRAIATSLGINLKDLVGDPGRKRFKQIRLDQTVLPGAPSMMYQDSWNIQPVEPITGAAVFGEWLDASGEDTGFAAGMLSEKGAFFTHVLLNDDLARKARFLLALIGRLDPEIWDSATLGQSADFGRVGRFDSVEALRAFATGRGASTTAIDEAVQLKQQADQLRASRRYGEALDRLAEAKGKLEASYYPLFSSKSPELRSVWCSVYASPSWPEMAKNLKANGLNAVFPFIGSAGLAYYPSKYLPTSEGVKHGRDPLKECVSVAHEAGLQVHVWFIAWYLHLATKETIERMKQENRLQIDASGHTTNWLCPARPENFEMVKNALLELAQNYDIDGIHFDYIRYPNQNYCFCDFCRQQFQKDTGLVVTDFIHDVTTGSYKSEFESWRRAQISRLVREVSRSARSLKPNLRISAAVFGGFSSARRAQAQDAANWAQQGYVDFLCPMNYTNDLAVQEKLTAEQLKALRALPAPNNRAPLVVGIGVFSDSSHFDSPAALLDQIDRTRQSGADGFVLFKYNAEMARRFLPALRLGVTRTDATIPWGKADQ